MTKKKIAPLALIVLSAFILAVYLLTTACLPARTDDLSLWQVYETKIKPRQFVDLTHAFSAAIPRWPGFPAEERKTIYTYEEDGFFAELFTHVGQYGTHCDPPGHFHKGLRMIDEIPVREMMLPLVVIDCSQKVAANPDYQLVPGDVMAWEEKHGRIPAGAVLALRAGLR